MKSDNKKQMPHDRQESAHSKGQTAKQHSQHKQDQPQGTFKGQTEPKGMGGTAGHQEKERQRDTLDQDKQSYNKAGASPDIQPTDTSSKAGFRKNDDKDADNRGASTSGIPGQGI